MMVDLIVNVFKGAAVTGEYGEKVTGVLAFFQQALFGIARAFGDADKHVVEHTAKGKIEENLFEVV